MKILLASSFLLFEGTRFGGAKRLYNIARDLEAEHDLTVVCFDGCRELDRWDHIPPFARFLVIPGAARPKYWKLRHALDQSALLKRHKKSVDTLLGNERFDCVILGYSLAPSLLKIPAIASCPKILYIEGDLVIGQADAMRKNARGFPEKIFREIRYRHILGYYRAFLKKIDTFFMSTLTEIESVNRRFPSVRTKQLGHGLDLRDIPLLSPPQIHGTAGFIGNFGHAPNLDALRWYLENVHPVLSRKHSGYRFVVAGMNFPAHLFPEGHEDPKLVILGPVESLEGFYEQISFMTNPIVSGKGVRTKVIEAAAYGRPVISTSLGADGTQPLKIRLGDSPADFTALCSGIINGENIHAEVIENRRLVENHFSTSAIIKNLLE